MALQTACKQYISRPVKIELMQFHLLKAKGSLDSRAKYMPLVVSDMKITNKTHLT